LVVIGILLVNYKGCWLYVKNPTPILKVIGSNQQIA
jgi:hypothetical protein